MGRPVAQVWAAVASTCFLWVRSRTSHERCLLENSSVVWSGVEWAMEAMSDLRASRRVGRMFAIDAF